MNTFNARPWAGVRTVAVALLLVAGCGDSPRTAIRLIVNMPEGTKVDQLHVVGTVGTAPLLTTDLPETPAGDLGATTDLVVWVADAVAGKDVFFTIDGNYQSARVAHGEGGLVPKSGKTLRITVQLTAATPCPTGQLNCDGVCTDPATDRYHCGRCDTACEASQICRSGECVHNPCGDAQHECSGVCYPDSDALHCGPACIACPVPAAHGTASCVEDRCQIDCAGGFVECPGSCVDLNTDPDNCGSCGHQCTGSQVCRNSNCTANLCSNGTHDCPGLGCVSNTDVAHCGMSCDPCVPPANATATCDGTSCGFVCADGFHDCGGACVSDASPLSCGASCIACPTPSNGTPTCDGVRCGVACSNGFKACGLDCIPNSATCANWRHLTTLGLRPPARVNAGMAYDSARGVTVLFGGWNDSGELGDTWEFDGNAWIQRLPAHQPSARDSVAIAFDVAHGKVVLYGGFAGIDAQGDTWLWDGTDWTSPSPTAATTPGPRYGAAALFDSLGEVILFGGKSTDTIPVLYNDLWLWNGTEWSAHAPAGTPPSGRAAAGFVRDGLQAVVFGGSDGWDMFTTYGDTFTVGLSGWSKVSGAGPSARAAAGFARNSTRGHAILFGGMSGQGSVVGETWSWNSGAWTKLTTPTAPSARGGTAMAYDAGRQVMVLFGGTNSSSYLDETWEFVQ